MPTIRAFRSLAVDYRKVAHLLTIVTCARNTTNRRLAAVIGLVVLVTGCLGHRTMRWETVFVSKPDVPDCFAPRLRLHQPTVVEAIGISNYRSDAGVDSTPAHMLGAAIFHQPFLAAALRTQQTLRDKLTFGSNWTPTYVGASAEERLMTVAISPDDRHVGAAYRMEKGSAIYIWGKSTKLEARFTRQREIARLKFAAADRVVLVGRDGTAEVVTVNGTTIRHVLLPDIPKSIAVNDQGTYALATSTNAAISIIPLRHGEGFIRVALPENTCMAEDPPDVPFTAEFDNSGTRVLISRCDGIWFFQITPKARLIHHFKMHFAGDSALPSVRADGRAVAFVSNTGLLHLGYLLENGAYLEDASNEVLAYRYDRTFKPIFSRDGSMLLAKPENGGWLQLWGVDKLARFRHGPTFLSDPGATTVLFGRSGHSLVATAGRKHQYVVGWNLDASYRNGRALVVDFMTLHSPLLSSPGDASKPQAIAINGAGSLALIGSENGDLRAVGLATTRAIESRFHVSLNVDFYALPSGRSAKSGYDPMYHVFSGIGGVDMFGRSGEFVFPERTTDAESAPMVRTLVTNLSSVFFKAAMAEKHNGRVLLVIYISAHGKLDRTGRPVILPADAIDAKPETWVPYQWFVDEVERFVEASSARNAILIFDACQKGTGHSDVVLPPSTRSQRVTIVQSTSPGQYAWHWIANRTVKTLGKEWSAGRGPLLFLTRRESDIDTRETISTTMSLFPFASTCALSVVDRGTMDRPPMAVTLSNWLTLTKRWVNGMEDEIPDMRKSGWRQDVQVTGADFNNDIWLFDYEH